MATFSETYEIIKNSEVFKRFINEHPDAELIAGFFILDFLSNDNKESVDYKLLQGNQIYTFELTKTKAVIMKQDRLIEVESPNQPKLSQIKSEVAVDLDRISEIAKKAAEEHNITATFNKIIAVLQNNEEKLIWNLTCMLDQLIILHILVDSQTGEVLKFERKSMMDFIKKNK